MIRFAKRVNPSGSSINVCIYVLKEKFSKLDHGGKAAMTWSLCDHHGETMTCGLRPHHGGFAAMTSELRSDYPNEA
jgi:hypothetical protein